ncbi:MAG: hypothetical protein O3A46_08855 [Candidatus Poribacteria bacterium]|nr:hypothetical protein [Candidatus Poribacteria bacterium]
MTFTHARVQRRLQDANTLHDIQRQANALLIALAVLDTGDMLPGERKAVDATREHAQQITDKLMTIQGNLTRHTQVILANCLKPSDEPTEIDTEQVERFGIEEVRHMMRVAETPLDVPTFLRRELEEQTA